MLDYLKKYQTGGSVGSSASYVESELSYIDPKVKSIMGGFSKSVYYDEDKTNLKSLHKTLGDLGKEIENRRAGKEPGEKYKDQSMDKLMNHYRKLDKHFNNTIKHKAQGYAEAAVRYLNGERRMALSMDRYNEEDRKEINRYIDKKIYQYTNVANEVFKDPTLKTAQESMKKREIGYTVTDVAKFKNGGKLVPKYQSGSSILNDSYILDLIQDPGTNTDPSSYNPPVMLDPRYTTPTTDGSTYGRPNVDGSSYTVPTPLDPNKFTVQPAQDASGYRSPVYNAAPYQGVPVQNAGQYKSIGDILNINTYKTPGSDPSNYIQETTNPINVANYGTPGDDVDYQDYIPERSKDTEGDYTTPSQKDVSKYGTPTGYLLPRTESINKFGRNVDHSFGQNQATQYSSVIDDYASADLEEDLVQKARGHKNTGVVREGMAPIVSRTGFNTPLGPIQFNDIAQLWLAKKAYDRPVAVTPVYQEDYQGRGSRTVRSISGIDPSIRSRVQKDIAKIGGSGYQGSDPIMQMITGMKISEAKRDARMDWAVKEAEHLRAEEERFARESEEKRQQISDDLVEANRVKNANELRVTEGKVKDAANEVAREAQWASNLGAVFNTIQGRWNANAKQRNTARAAIWKENKDREYNLALKQYDDNERTLRYAEGTHRLDRQKYVTGLDKNLSEAERQQKVNDYDKAFKESNKELYENRSKYAEKLGLLGETDMEETMYKHDVFSKGDSLLNLNYGAREVDENK